MACRFGHATDREARRASTRGRGQVIRLRRRAGVRGNSLGSAVTLGRVILTVRAGAVPDSTGRDRAVGRIVRWWDQLRSTWKTLSEPAGWPPLPSALVVVSHRELRPGTVSTVRSRP